MEKLLHWSIANSQGDKEAIEKVGQPDPKLLGQLFGTGPDEPTLMREGMAVITNPEAELDSRLVAFDNFEMLIENMDNANNIENLRLWEPLLKMFDAPEADLRTCALSCVGTAAQNNAQTQDNFLNYNGGLRKVIELAGNPNEPTSVRTKALYALSNLIRNHAAGSEEFSTLHGLEIVPPIIRNPEASNKLKLRALSLLSAFLSSSIIDSKLMLVLRKEGIMESTIECLNLNFDVNIVDRVLNILAQLISAKIYFNEQEKNELRKGMQNIESEKDKLNEDDLLTVKYVL